MLKKNFLEFLDAERPDVLCLQETKCSPDQVEQLWWYDPMPHPDNQELQSTHPHHKHVLPDIKHHRIPAPGLSFTEPNLSQLIAEVEQMS